MLSHTNFLRVSSETLGLGIDLTVIASGEVPSVEGGAELQALAEALTTETDADPAAERDALVAALGPELAERAVGVCATFQMMNIMLDATGAPVRGKLDDIAAILGFEPSDITR